MCQCVRALHRCADGRLPMPLGAHWDLQKREERKKGLDKSGHIEGPLLGIPPWDCWRWAHNLKQRRRPHAILH
jgi:hypothetical protein